MQKLDGRGDDYERSRGNGIGYGYGSYDNQGSGYGDGMRYGNTHGTNENNDIEGEGSGNWYGGSKNTDLIMDFVQFVALNQTDDFLAFVEYLNLKEK